MERGHYWSNLAQVRVDRRRALAATGAAGLGVALLAACGGGGGSKGDVSGLITKPQDTAKEAKRGGTLLQSRNQDVFTSDGQSSLIGGIGAATIYNRLIRLKPGYLQPPALEFQGDLAESWEFSPDKLHLTLKLRSMTWHNIAPVNGRRLDAQDVVTGWQRWEKVGTTRGNYSAKVNPDAPVESMIAVDDRTVAIRLNQPVSSILGLLATSNAGMFFLPREADETYDPRTVGIGSSAFFISNFTPSASLTLRRHDGFYDAQRVYIDEIREFIVPEYATGLSQFRSGALHLFPVRQEDILATKRDVPALNLYVEDPPAQYGIFRFGWNPALKTPFRDKRLRQALALSIDRDLWVDTFYNVGRYAAEGIALNAYLHTAVQANTAGVFAGLESYWLNPRDKEFGPNAKYFQNQVAEAKKLVAAAGFANGVEATANYPLTPGYGDAFIKQLDVFTDMAKAAGITFIANNPNFNVDFRPKFGDSPGDFDGVTTRFRPAGGIFDPVEVAVYEFVPNAGISYSGFFSEGSSWKQGDAAYTTLLKRARQEFDEKKRISLLQDFQRMEAENQYQPSFPGVASGLSLAWPAVRNVNVNRLEPPAFVVSGAALQRVGVWLDTTLPPFKSG